MDPRRLQRLLPLAVFVFALLLRLPGLGWGLKNDLRNASLHPDETVNFGNSRAVVPALGRFTSGGLPTFYSYGTLYLTTLSVASDVATGYTGAPKTREGFVWGGDPTRTDWDWVSRCIVAGRLVSLVAGALMAATAFALGRRIGGTAAGLLAGAFVAIAPALVVHSRFMTPDIPAAALIGGALYFAVRALDPKEEKAHLTPATWCGILAGLSAGVKYTGILVLLALYAALALGKREGWVRQAVVATVVALATFVVTTPGTFLETGAFLQGVAFELRHTATGQDLFFTGTSSGFAFHLVNLFLGIGPLLVLMALAGLGWAAYRRHSWAIVLLAFMLPYYVLIGRAEIKYMRYTFPLTIGLAAGFGYAVTAAQRRGWWGRAAVAGTILGFGGIPGGGFRDAATLTLGMAGEDPRDQAGRMLRGEPLSVGLARDPWYWSPSLVPDGAAPRSYWSVIRAELQANRTPPIVYPLTPDGKQTYFDLALFDQKPARVAISNFEFDYPERLRGRTDLRPEDAGRVAAANAWVDRLRAEYEPEKVFANDSPYGIEDMDYVRPVITVWKRKTP